MQNAYSVSIIWHLLLCGTAPAFWFAMRNLLPGWRGKLAR